MKNYDFSKLINKHRKEVGKSLTDPKYTVELNRNVKFWLLAEFCDQPDNWTISPSSYNPFVPTDGIIDILGLEITSYYYVIK